MPVVISVNLIHLNINNAFDNRDKIVSFFRETYREREREMEGEREREGGREREIKR